MKQTSENVSQHRNCNRGRNSYVVTRLTEALLALLAQKPFGEISVSELTEKASVGRVSFYRNFESKEDILRAYLESLFDEWASESKSNAGAPLSEQVRTMIAHFEAHRTFYQLLNERGLTYLLKDGIIRRIGPKPEYDKAQAYATAFFAYSLYGWVDVWFQRGMKETADELAELFKAQGL